MYRGKGYGDFKADLADVVVNSLLSFQERFRAISDEEILSILKNGAQRAQELASKKMVEVKEKVGFVL
jgi:tryptophanyl-tRNA synthetase